MKLEHPRLEYGTKIRCIDAKDSLFQDRNGNMTELKMGEVYTIEHDHQGNVDTKAGTLQVVEHEGIVYNRSRFELVDQKPQHKLVYLSAPYSKYKNKNALMMAIMTMSGLYQVRNAGNHVVSPLFNHFSLDHVPEMGSDYAFWGDYSRNLLKRCDKIIVIMLPGWDESVGVEDEVKLAQELGLEVEFVDPRIFNYDTAVFATLLSN